MGASERLSVGETTESTVPFALPAVLAAVQERVGETAPGCLLPVAGMACLGATSVSCSCAYSQPREPLGEALEERVAEMRASHQQNLPSQNPARVLGCDFCPPAVCAASFPRSSQGWSQLQVSDLSSDVVSQLLIWEMWSQSHRR